nr:MAG TPA: hypothetical protein [Caudoviricetes sp.]
MNITVLFRVVDFTDPISIQVAKNLTKETYLKRVSMVIDTLANTLHKPIKVNYNSEDLTCTIKIEDSISFIKYKVLAFYLKRIDILGDIRLAFNATDAFTFKCKRFFHIFKDDKEYVAVILQGYKLRNVIQTLTLVTNTNIKIVDIPDSTSILPNVNQLLDTYYNLFKDLKD